MELTDYLAVVRRHWRIWVASTVLGLVAGAAVLQLTPPTYEATARVFVSVSPSIPSSAQFVNQRVKSYPQVALSQAVLGTVIEKLDLDLTARELRARVSADNPADTSQVEVSVSGRDPEEAAAIANEVAEQLTEVVQDLETPASGNRPVTLTVSDPAAVPVQPVAPVALFVLALGLCLGLFPGLAAAVIYSRMDSRLHTESDVRRAWGPDRSLDLLVVRSGRAGRSPLTGDPATGLARRLELAAEGRPIRIALVSPAPDGSHTARRLGEDVATQLVARGISAAVADLDVSGPVPDQQHARVRLEVGDPLAPLRVWREIAVRDDGVVLVLPRGRVQDAELREVRDILRDAGIEPLAVVLTTGARVRGSGTPAPEEDEPSGQGTLPVELRNTGGHDGSLNGDRRAVPDSKRTLQRRS
jgi:capsular polysaccharide biosynthesis protein